MIQLIFRPLFELNDKTSPNQIRQESFSSNNSSFTYSQKNDSNFFKKAIEKASNTMNRASSGVNHIGSSNYRRLGSPEATTVALICTLYESALNTLTQIKLDILTGLCYQDLVLPSLWKFICSLGPGNGMKVFLDHLVVHTKTCAPEFQILILFCDCATHLITILDDMEMYDQQRPFSIEDFIVISSFLNNFVFKIIWNNLIGKFFPNIHKYI